MGNPSEPTPADAAVRLDQWLHAARFFKTRALAARLNLAVDWVDLQACTTSIAQWMSNPCLEDFKLLVRVARYLRHNPGYRQRFRQPPRSR